MTQESENELIPPPPPQWAVITCVKRQTKQEVANRAPKIISHHELLYGGRVVSKMTGENGRQKLQLIAKFFNRHGTVPRPTVQCLADDVGSMETRLRKQTEKADKAQARPNP